MKGIQRNGFLSIIAQAISEMEEIHGEFSSLDEINLAELGRRTGLSRAKLRRLKTNGFCEKAHGLNGQKKEHILDGYSSVLDTLLKSGVSNSTVCLERLQTMGFTGSRSTVKRYIAAHKHLIPAKRQLVAPQGNRGRRYTTEPGETYQMDWGFTDVLDYDGKTYRVACFAMICHHCGQQYIEFFPNARQENLFIGIVHAFQYMGIPRFVLTDNMKSVVLPTKAPKTFENFDFSLLKGKDVERLKVLASLNAIYSHRNLAFIGPAGTGKTHLAQAFGYACCQHGLKTYFIKASELRDRFTAARRSGKTDSCLNGLVRPSCLIIDEIGHCAFDKENTRLFFDLIDRRYNKEGSFNMIFTSNKNPALWREDFEEDATLLCTLDRIFDDATVFKLRGESFRGKKLETVSLQTGKVSAIEPIAAKE